MNFFRKWGFELWVLLLVYFCLDLLFWQIWGPWGFAFIVLTVFPWYFFAKLIPMAKTGVWRGPITPPVGGWLGKMMIWVAIFWFTTLPVTAVVALIWWAFNR